MESDKYKNSVIYRIYCKNTDIKDCYIGSSKSIYFRMNSHKSVCCNKTISEYNEKKYEFIRNNGGWDNFDYEILEYYPCNNFEELRQKEQEYIEKLNPSLNDAPCFRTEEFKKERIKINQKNWEQTDSGKESRLNSSRKYTEKLMNNPEKHKKKLENKSEWGKKPKYCEVCDINITNNRWYIHQKSKEHLDNLKEQSIINDDEYNKILETVEENKNIERYCEFCRKNIKKKHWNDHIKTKNHLKNVENSKNGINELDDKNKMLCKYCDVILTKKSWNKHTKTEKHLKNVEIYEKKINELDDKNKILCEEC